MSARQKWLDMCLGREKQPGRERPGLALRCLRKESQTGRLAPAKALGTKDTTEISSYAGAVCCLARTGFFALGKNEPSSQATTSGVAVKMEL